MHHCLVDGVAGAGLLPVLLTPTPQATFARAADWEPKSPPGPMRLFFDALARRTQAVTTVAAEARRLASDPGQARQWLDALRGIWRTIELGVQRAPESPINRPIEPHRRVSWLVSDFEQVRAIRARLGGTVNDVVLAAVAGALRRFLRERDPEIAIEDHHALVPVSVRTGDDDQLGNRVSAWIVALPAGTGDALECHARIRDATAELRASHVARGGELLTGLSSLLLTIGLPLVERVQPFNLVVSNIPGPPMPLYLLGSRLIGVHPHVPLFPNQALSVALMSYAGRLGWGFVGDCHAMADLDRFASAVSAALDELAEKAGVVRRADAAAVDVGSPWNGHDRESALRSPPPPGS
jgi:WS/DGAT/MGAT family acyltransferase